jgi:hypothetical protein
VATLQKVEELWSGSSAFVFLYTSIRSTFANSAGNAESARLPSEIHLRQKYFFAKQIHSIKDFL